jgi:hypothetical protein
MALRVQIVNWGLFFLEQIKCLLLLSNLRFELKLLIDILTDTVSDNSSKKYLVSMEYSTFIDNTMLVYYSCLLMA